MSFGDPNNPYGQQPQAPQGQPGYGYPQQAPQGVPPQGGYAYPQQAPQAYPGGPAGYPGGYPGGAQAEMPGGAKAARVILFILGGLSAAGGLFAILGGALFASAFSGSSGSSSDAGTAAGGIIIVMGVIILAVSLWPILTAAKLSKGRGGVRVSGIVYGSLQTLFAGLSLLINLAALGSADSGAGPVAFSLLIAVVSLGLGIWVIVGLAKSGDYFNRPRY